MSSVPSSPLLPVPSMVPQQEEKRKRLAAVWLVRILFSKTWGTTSQVEHVLNLLLSEEGQWFGFRADRERHFGPILQYWRAWYQASQYRHLHYLSFDAFHEYEILSLMDLIPEELQTLMVKEIHDNFKSSNPSANPFPIIQQPRNPQPMC